MKKLIYFLVAGIMIFPVSCKSKQKKEAPKEEGWVTLFDGTSLKGWRGVNKDTIPVAWVIEDGMLHCIGSGNGEASAENGGDILYDRKFGNFHLKFEWKISEGGNSGVFYLGQEVKDWPMWKTAPKFQLLDNAKNSDATLGKEENPQAGSLYDLIPAKLQNTKPAGEWNTAEIMVYKGTVVHRQNGETILEYNLWTDDWEKLVAGSKFPALNPDFANVAKEGYIALQDDGSDVWFRNIQIKEL